MKLRKGDKVIVTTGSDKGKTGAIQKVLPKVNKVIVEGVALRKKHMKPSQANPEGAIREIYAPISASNVALIDPSTKKATKVRYQDVKGKKVRVAKKSGKNLD